MDMLVTRCTIMISKMSLMLIRHRTQGYQGESDALSTIAPHWRHAGCRETTRSSATATGPLRDSDCIKRAPQGSALGVSRRATARSTNAISGALSAPLSVSTRLPCRKTQKVGIVVMRSSVAHSSISSTSSRAKSKCECRAHSAAKMGATARQGAHLQ